MKHDAALALALMAASCMNRPPSTEILPPGLKKNLRHFLRTSSDEDIRRHAVQMAREHVRAGTPYVAWCGIVASYRPNIPAEMQHLVAGLPPLDLPSGCLDPLALKGAWFALAYNGELMRRLALKIKTDCESPAAVPLPGTPQA